MIIKEHHKISIHQYPFNDSLKERIKEELKYYELTKNKMNADGSVTNVKAPQTLSFSENDFKSVKCITQWIPQCLPSFLKLRLSSYWIAQYGQGDYTVKHSHIPSTYTFVYFIESPRGSSPLVFSTSGRKVLPKEGRLVVFPGCIKHHVPKNHSEGRLILAGDLMSDWFDKS